MSDKSTWPIEKTPLHTQNTYANVVLEGRASLIFFFFHIYSLFLFEYPCPILRWTLRLPLYNRGERWFLSSVSTQKAKVTCRCRWVTGVTRQDVGCTVGSWKRKPCESSGNKLTTPDNIDRKNWTQNHWKDLTQAHKPAKIFHRFLLTLLHPTFPLSLSLTLSLVPKTQSILPSLLSSASD